MQPEERIPFAAVVAAAILGVAIGYFLGNERGYKAGNDHGYDRGVKWEQEREKHSQRLPHATRIRYLVWTPDEDERIEL